MPNGDAFKKVTREIGVGIGLCAIVFFIYGQTFGFDFVKLDDDVYVSNNPMVKQGLNLHTLKWAFGFQASHWFPLTWLSFMTECELFGCAPGVLHVSNVVLHALNSALVFLVFRNMTQTLWSSAWLGFLFAAHPLRVESVAWITERKDVLSAFFGLLALLAYVHYVQRNSWKSYWASVAFFALSLMSKSMWVTLPILLLLLDDWPLGRFRNTEAPTNQPLRKLLFEKIPYVILSFVCGVLALLAWSHGEAFRSFETFPLATRLANAVLAYMAYIADALWPSALAVYYPYPQTIPAMKLAWAVFLLLGLSVFIFRSAARFPYARVGWLWFLIALLPVIGVFQNGSQARADRFTYLPLIGLFAVVVWGLSDLGKYALQRLQAPMQQRWVVRCLRLLGVLVAGGLMWTSHRQTSHWENTISLFTHSLRVEPRAAIAYHNLGRVYLEEGNLPLAEQFFHNAVGLAGASANLRNSYGEALYKQHKLDEAKEQFQLAVRLEPRLVTAHNNLGAVYASKGRYDLAIESYQKAIALDSSLVVSHYNAGNAYLAREQHNDALREFETTLELQPNHAEAANNLGVILYRQGFFEQAVAAYERAIAANVTYAEAHNNLGAVKMAMGDIEGAIESFKQALRINPNYPNARGNLQIAQKSVSLR